MTTGSRLLSSQISRHDCSEIGDAGWSPWMRLTRLLSYKRLIHFLNERALARPTEFQTPNQATLDKASQQTGPLYMEDVRVGDRWSSPWREITADDVADFARLTGDHDPLHSDQGGSSPFGMPVAHGLLGLSVLAGLGTEHPQMATLALVGIADWRFEAPVYFGDSVRVITEIETIEKHGRRAGRITWVHKLVNQNGGVVQQGRFISLVATRARARHLTESAPTQRGTLPAR